MLLITVHGSRKESLISLKKMFRLVIALALVAATLAFSPSRMVARKTELNMNLQQQISKGLGIAAMGIALAGPVSLPAFADGAVSISTVYRARNNYGAKIFALSDAAASGNFAAFEDKKTKNAFELFMSSANALNSITDKANKKAELGIYADIQAAVASGNKGALASSFAEFVKVADLKPAYKKSEVGQTDSSGYSPTWGTDRQQIYQR